LVPSILIPSDQGEWMVPKNINHYKTCILFIVLVSSIVFFQMNGSDIFKLQESPPHTIFTYLALEEDTWFVFLGSIFWDPSQKKCVYWFHFMLGSFDIRFSLFIMVTALVCWSFGVLARRLSACLLQQTLLRESLHGYDEG
jgi:hypothetical protein